MRVTITEYTGPVRWGYYYADGNGTHRLLKEWSHYGVPPANAIECRTTFDPLVTVNRIRGHWHEEVGGDYLLIPLVAEELCPLCEGGGTVVAPDDLTHKCPDCHGTGRRG